MIVIERRSKREGLEFVIPTRTSGNSRFVMKVYCMFCLDPSASFEPVAVGVLVNSGFNKYCDMMSLKVFDENGI